MGRGLDDQDLRSQGNDDLRDRVDARSLDRNVERSDPRAEIRDLCETREERDRSLDRSRTHSLQLPDGERREHVITRDHDYRLRGSEVDLLEAVGRYRAVFVEDLSRETSDRSRLATDLASLEEQGLLETRTISRFDPDESADVVALTEEGELLLDDHRDPDEDVGQEYHSGWVKPRELWHDAELYHMVRDFEIDVEHGGGEIVRVVLDDELKSEAFDLLYDLREEDGLSDDIAHRRVADALNLHLEDGHFVFPDVRVEIRDGGGEVRSRDLELVTEHYRDGHLGGKSAAGFRMFRSGGGGSRGATPLNPPVYLP
jgi:hypothetical protein